MKSRQFVLYYVFWTKLGSVLTSFVMSERNFCFAIFQISNQRCHCWNEKKIKWNISFPVDALFFVCDADK